MSDIMNFYYDDHKFDILFFKKNGENFMNGVMHMPGRPRLAYSFHLWLDDKFNILKMPYVEFEHVPFYAEPLDDETAKYWKVKDVIQSAIKKERIRILMGTPEQEETITY
jgi:hypothetical protein